MLALHSISKQEERKGLKGEIYAIKKSCFFPLSQNEKNLRREPLKGVMGPLEGSPLLGLSVLGS